MSKIIPRDVGPKYGYPRLGHYSERLAIVAELARPFTVFSAFLVGLFLGFILHTNWLNSLLIGLLFAVGQAVGQTVNQIADVYIDRINKPYRPIPSGRITEREAWRIALYFTIIGLVIALGLVITTLNYLAVASSYSMMLFMAVFYSLEPIRAKTQGAWFSLFWQAIARGLLPPIYASWIITGNPIALWPLSLLAFVWVLALQATKDFDDIEGDRMYGVETLPVKYGVKGAVRRMQLIVIIYTFLDLTLVYLHYVTPWLLLMIPTAITAFLALGKETVTENNLAWNIYYLGLALHYVLFLL